MVAPFSHKRLPTRRKKKLNSKNGIFNFTLFMLIVAAVLLSISTFFLSWNIIEKEKLRGNTIPLPEEMNIVHHHKQKQLNRETKVEVGIDQPKSANTVKVEVSGGTLNSEIYQPAKKGRRLLTYKRFGGRLNNQLFQFITALQHAKVLKRTLVVPNEIRDVDWTGMFDVGLGIWDLESLNNEYDIDWTVGLTPEFAITGKDEGQRYINDEAIPKECMLHWKKSPQLLNGGPDLWRSYDEKCPDVIDIAGNTGLLFCGQQHRFCGDEEAQLEAYKIYSHIKLSPSLMQYIPSRRKEFRNQGYDELAIHSRRAGEGAYNWELCVNGNKKTCVGHLSGDDRAKFCDLRTMTGNCAVWVDLEYQIKSKSALKPNQKDYRFVLASDGTHDWSIDFKNQFIVANNTDWLLDLEKKEMAETMSISAIANQRLRDRKGGKLKSDTSPMKDKLHALTLTLLDLFSLVDSKYLLGAYFSTLSLNACYFRGVDRMYDSNMCWMFMHPNDKFASIPSFKDSVNIKPASKDDQLPAALLSDVEHAFVRSEDGNFIAIDRYLVRYKKKETIGVVGDGLLPITISEDENGEETIQADFTCSYGDVHNSPATVILIKGNMSYKEHYYERGEKYNTPFSTNGDRFRTAIVLCEKLQFNKGISRHPPLILRSADDKFFISIGSTYQRPVGMVYKGANRNQKRDDKLVHCLNPAYGLKDPRWIVEYLEYHRAVGVSHVHVYNVDMHTPEVQAALQIYRDEGFITRHDWSEKASGGYTTKKTYEHAKWAAQTDCALRSRDIFHYALFSDLDEIVVGDPADGLLTRALEMCEEAKKSKGKIACSFNSNTVSSIYTKLNDDEEKALKDKLILERYNRIEASPHCPSNCRQTGATVDRKFHYGRQKYILNVKDLEIQPRPMWTHALARDYTEMEKLMEVLPDDVMHVRHYQGHWYKNNNLLNSMEEKEVPLPQGIMKTVHESIHANRAKILIYDKAKAAATRQGIEWIEPVERPTQYHTIA